MYVCLYICKPNSGWWDEGTKTRLLSPWPHPEVEQATVPTPRLSKEAMQWKREGRDVEEKDGHAATITVITV